MTEQSPAALLSALIAELYVDGGSVSVVSRTGMTSTIASSGATASRIAAIQADLGEGPGLVARDTAAPVVVTDLATAESRWPMFTEALVDYSVGGVLALPMLIGFQVVGVVDLYTEARDRVWSDDTIAGGLRAAALLARPAVRLATRSAAAQSSLAGTGAAELRREVHQATGLLMVGLDVPPDQALAQMEAYAFAVGRPVLDVARDLIAGRLDARAISG